MVQDWDGRFWFRRSSNTYAGYLILLVRPIGFMRDCSVVRVGMSIIMGVLDMGVLDMS